MNSNEIRQQLRLKRRSLPPLQQQQAARALADLIIKSVFFQKATRVGFYLANDGEIDPSLILSAANDLGKQCFLPVVDPKGTHSLYFASFNANTKLQANRYGILEPISSESKNQSVKNIDLLFMPLVGFDKTGNRIGMGGGYYDRTLAFMKKTETPALTLVGLAHSEQEISHISSQSWDIPLHLIATEKEIICVRPR
ncbi:5-formyltetrahydrofolate cyclo-ligase [Gammaproteobacteria bacterium]|nr:5-formyltetrahydrofolate cyclo-ligase [Gammaproteobacteria bacterium]|tara:strand:- start:1301 stop:1891 length:591 start_codon:yes stop_codon:yes gene_type:complete